MQRLCPDFYILQGMSDRHERFAGKNAALVRIWGMDAKEKQKQRTEKSEVKVGRCDKCGQIKPLRTYRTQQHDRTEGAASYGVTFQHL
ncbi:MAG TPA: hypothetical protein VLM37_05700, partial [Fibrobacteraceae bacterium]|nr:hypothetical protein [Fibrobacteraceae bacterium]